MTKAERDRFKQWQQIERAVPASLNVLRDEPAKRESAGDFVEAINALLSFSGATFRFSVVDDVTAPKADPRQGDLLAAAAPKKSGK